MISEANTEAIFIVEENPFGNQSSLSYKTVLISANLTPEYTRETRMGILRNYDQARNFNIKVKGTFVKTLKYTALDEFLIQNIVAGNSTFKLYFESDNRYLMVSGCKLSEWVIGIRKQEFITISCVYSGMLSYAETPFTLDYSPLDDVGNGMTHLNCVIPFKSTDLTFSLKRDTSILLNSSQQGFNHVNSSDLVVDVQDTRYISGVDELDDLFLSNEKTITYIIGSKTWQIRGYPTHQEPVIQPQLADTLRQINFVNCKLTIT